MAARGALVGQTPQSGPATASESAGDQTQNVEMARQEAPPQMPGLATTPKTDHYMPNLTVLGLNYLDDI